VPVLLPIILGLSVLTPKQDEKEVQADAPKISPEDQVVHMIKLAKLAEQKQELGKAEDMYHRALSLLVIYHQNKQWEEQQIIQARVYIYDGMANLALIQGHLDKAETLFKETLRGLIQQGMKKDDEAVIEISLKLAMIYAAQNRNDEANEGYQFCITTMEANIEKMSKVDDNTKALLGMCTDAYSRFLIKQKRYNEALECLQKALNLARTVFGDLHQQVAVLLNDVATVLSLLQKYELAKEKLHQAIEVAEASYSPDLPTLHCNLGAIHVQTGDIAQAKAQYSKALVVAKQNNDKAIVKKANDALEQISKNSK